jgi:carbamate kinase
MCIVITLGARTITNRFQPASCVPDKHAIVEIAKVLSRLSEAFQAVVTHGAGRGPFSGSAIPDHYSAAAGYLLEQELLNERPSARIAHVLTQNLVDAPTSNMPTTIAELNVIRAMLDHGYTVICSGIGGTPLYRAPSGRLEVGTGTVDKDYASALLGRQLNASCLMMLTDVPAVHADYGTPQWRPIRTCAPEALGQFSFDAESMGAKVRAACEFAANTQGRACIGSVDQAEMSLYGYAGTTIRRGAEFCYGDA